MLTMDTSFYDTNMQSSPPDRKSSSTAKGFKFNAEENKHLQMSKNDTPRVENGLRKKKAISSKGIVLFSHKEDHEEPPSSISLASTVSTTKYTEKGMSVVRVDGFIQSHLFELCMTI